MKSKKNIYVVCKTFDCINKTVNFDIQVDLKSNRKLYRNSLRDPYHTYYIFNDPIKAQKYYYTLIEETQGMIKYFCQKFQQKIWKVEVGEDD
jgi:hypothetical protein